MLYIFICADEVLKHQLLNTKIWFKIFCYGYEYLRITSLENFHRVYYSFMNNFKMKCITI